METQRTITTQVTLVRRQCPNEFCDDGQVNEYDGHEGGPKYGWSPRFKSGKCQDCGGKSFIEHTAAMWAALDAEAQLEATRHELAQTDAQLCRTIDERDGLKNTVASLKTLRGVDAGAIYRQGVRIRNQDVEIARLRMLLKLAGIDADKALAGVSEERAA